MAAARDIEAVRRVALRWSAAMGRADLATLDTLMADDIVVIHGNGRCVSGKAAVLADLARSFAVVRVAQQIESDETIICGEWAFDRARIRTTVVRQDSGEARDILSRAVTLLRRNAGQWVVARAIGVVEQA